MQTTNNILLIRPANFVFNSETAESNAFQNQLSKSKESINQKVIEEFDSFASTLQSLEVNTFVFDDTPDPEKPDAIFSNNWISYHPDGRVILYPMYAPNRRAERRPEIIETLKKRFIVNEVIDLSFHENEGRFLESTGSIVFDHQNKIAYACLSPRTDKKLFIDLCDELNYRPVYFSSFDENGKEIFHTNVMMCIGSRFAVICLDSIKDKNEHRMVAELLRETGHEIIDISLEQVKRFAGNMLALKTNSGTEILAMSKTAFDSLTQGQIDSISKFTKPVPLQVNMIETIGGGSARCMITEVFLQEKLSGSE